MQIQGTIGEIIDMKTTVRGMLGVLLVAGVAACGSAQADGTDDQAATEAFVRVVNVEVSVLEAEDFAEEIRLTSVATANRDVLIAAEESGVIRELFADRGDRVAAGDPIAKIDDRLLQAQVDQARAAAELAEQTWQRRQRLWEEDRVGSELAYLEAKYASEQTAANVAALETRLERTTIRAPFAGVLEQRLVEVGSMVNPGQSIGRLVDLDPIKVFAGVPERYATDVSVGGRAELAFDALGGERFGAPIRYVGTTVDPQSRTFAIEVEVPNRAGRIKPEMVANMSIVRTQVDGAIVVPQDALVREEDGYTVYVVTERDGETVAEVREVVLGPSRRNLVVLESGVAAGERLIVVGQKSVASGDRVRIVAER